MTSDDLLRHRSAHGEEDGTCVETHRSDTVAFLFLLPQQMLHPLWWSLFRNRKRTSRIPRLRYSTMTVKPLCVSPQWDWASKGGTNHQSLFRQALATSAASKIWMQMRTLCDVCSVLLRRNVQRLVGQWKLTNESSIRAGPSFTVPIKEFRGTAQDLL